MNDLALNFTWELEIQVTQAVEEAETGAIRLDFDLELSLDRLRGEPCMLPGLGPIWRHDSTCSSDVCRSAEIKLY